MRPLNLIPAEARTGEQRPLRSGPLAYIVVGALVAVLAGVAALVLTGNQISERESEIARLAAKDTAATERAASLASYTQFRTMREQRLATISSLADSRFDWERVMRELALILPDDAWLVSLNASASPNSGSGGSEGSETGGGGLRGSAPGPALELSGCAAGQEAVAGFVTALKDIDGVTRVGVESSQLSEEEEGAGNPQPSASGEGGGGSGGGGDCRTRDFIAQFQIVVAFDAAPVPLSPEAETAPLAATEETESTSTETEGG